MIKNILVPTDGSAHAERAFDYACDLALKYEAELHFVHVVSEAGVPEGLDEFIRSERIQDQPRERVTESGRRDYSFNRKKGERKRHQPSEVSGPNWRAC